MEKIQNKSLKTQDIKDAKPKFAGEKILLHCCCGPCALEPYRILQSLGWDITIYYSNNNIYPESEFYKRQETINNWAKNNNIKVINDDYNPKLWEIDVYKLGKHELKSPKRIERCSECYKHRLIKSAEFASSNNINSISSSLAVSPYQLNDQLNILLNEVANDYNLNPVFLDFRPFYKNAVTESKNQRMYRQKYCGCKLSLYESIAQFKKSKNKNYLNELLEKIK